MITIERLGRWAVFSERPPAKLEVALYSMLAFERQGAEFMPNPAWAWVRFYDKKRRRFPWGLMHRAEKILAAWKTKTGEDVTINTTQHYVGVRSDVVWSDGLRDYQQDAVNKLVENAGGVISMPTGSGKTRTIMAFLNRHNFVRPLVVVPTRDLVTQWSAEFEARYEGDECSVRTYAAVARWPSVALQQYDCIVFDEEHHVAAKSVYGIAMNGHNALLVGCSATPYRNDGQEMRIEAALGTIVYSIDVATLVRAGWLCQADVHMVTMPPVALSLEDEYPQAYDKAIVHNAYRNERIVEAALKTAEDGLVLVLVDRIEHAHDLATLLAHRGPLSHINVVTGENTSRASILDDARAGRTNILVATTGIYGEGVDLPNVRTLIVAGGGKSSVGVVQRIGRALRTMPGKTRATIIDYDDKTQYLKRHSLARRRIYEELYGGVTDE